MQGGKPLTMNHADVSTCNSWEDFEIHDRNITLGTWIENKNQMACI